MAALLFSLQGCAGSESTPSVAVECASDTAPGESATANFVGVTAAGIRGDFSGTSLSSSGTRVSLPATERTVVVSFFALTARKVTVLALRVDHRREEGTTVLFLPDAKYEENVQVGENVFTYRIRVGTNRVAKVDDPRLGASVISGVVRTGDGTPLDEVLVSSGLYSAYTNANGQYFLNVPGAGSYTVDLYKDGYSFSTPSFDVAVTEPYSTVPRGAVTGTLTGGAAAWSLWGKRLGAQPVWAVVPDAASSTCYAGTDSGLYQSTDGGENWSVVTGLQKAPVYAVAVAPGDPRVVYAGTQSGVFASADGGSTWSASGKGIPPATFVYRLLIDPASNRNVYCLTQPAASVQGFAIYRSTDAGATWSRAGAAMGDLLDLALDPSGSGVLYAIGSGSGVYRSGDAGATWSGVSDSSLAPHALAGGLAVDPKNPQVLYAAGSDLASVYKSVNGGASWWRYTSGIAGGTVAVWFVTVDPANSLVLYAAGAGGVLKSTNGGASWFKANSGLKDAQAMAPVVVAPWNRQRLYAATQGGIYLSTSGGI